MVKKILLVALAFCFLFGSSGIASAREVVFINHTDFNWVGLNINYDNVAQQGAWGANLLNGQVYRGGSVVINVHGTQSNVYKIRIMEISHGQYYKYTWYDVNLEGADKVAFYFDRSTGKTRYLIVRD